MTPSKQTLARLVGIAARRPARCFFVLSTGRVGTVTLTRLLALTRRTQAEHEPGPQLLEETRLAYQRHPLSMRDGKELFLRFADSRARALLRASQPGRLYAECSNRLTFLAPVLAGRLPRSRFLHLYRHPAAVVRSGMRRGWYRDNPWDPHRIEPRPDDPWAADWSEWEPFEKCCWLWNAVNEFCLEVTDSLPDDRVRRVSMESLFDPAGSAAEALFEWLGISPVERTEVLRILGTRYNSQRENDFPPWEEWSRERRAALASITGETAAQLGYGLN